MKKILGFLSAALVMGIALTACNNSGVPFREVADAVKTANAMVSSQQSFMADSTSITYDELTNVVKYTVYLPYAVRSEEIGAQAATLEAGFVHDLVANDAQHLCNPILNAKSNVLIDIEGRDDTKYEIMIENKTIADAKAALIEE